MIRQAGDTTAESVVKTWKANKTVKAYTFQQAGIEQPSEEYYTSWRYCLEHFVNKVRSRAMTSGMWLDDQFSVDVAKMMDMAYLAAGLPLRPTRGYILE